ncbi:DNA repair protein RecO [Aquihabitans sp. G128]|uniref:DNA repair protein RecO n=1 Tax=Aquihabitans sp. G128 TaxID=2849779 RepID=UPI001C2443A1|nr:DNA repair protein RecO [Aquihabitans sp. G128]QXC62386.1 DNA repair protein RecO [Aquihabitans sp. G128]
MALYRDQGIVLRTYKLGEADRIVTFITERHGKVRAVAKGVRKTKSKFGARLEPTSHVALQLYEGRELDIVTQAESIDHFKAIREDLDRLTRAVTMLEAVDQLSLEREPNPDLYRMLLGALRTVAAKNSALVVAGFHWKILALEGFRPQVESCVVCDTPDGLVSFDPTEGGLLCGEHRRGTRVSPQAVELLQQILGGRLALALEAESSPATHEVDNLATRVMEHHLERRLRSVGLLD